MPDVSKSKYPGLFSKFLSLYKFGSDNMFFSVNSESSASPSPQRSQFNFLGRFTFHYCGELIRRGFRRELLLFDFPIIENDDEASKIAEKIQTAWDCELKVKFRIPNLARATFWKYRMDFCFSGLFYFLESCTKKCLRLSVAHSSSTGYIVNLVSNDVQRIEDCIPYLHFLWVAPVEAIFVLFFMYQQIGLSAVFAIIAVFAWIPVQGLIARNFARFRKEAVAQRDERIRTLSDSLAGINIVKLYAWETPFIKRIEEKRTAELEMLKKANYLRSFNDAFSFASTVVISMFAFIPFYLLGGELTSARVFTTLALIQIVRSTMMINFSKATQFGSEALVSFPRVQEFFLLPELQHFKDNILRVENLLNKNDSDREPERKTMIAFEDCEFAWPSASLQIQEEPKSILKNVTFSVCLNELVGICGQVGSGKTSLLNTILNEMEILAGEFAVRREIKEDTIRAVKIAYVSQSSWIISGTIKENILFGQKFDESWFREVIEVCALDTDLNLFQDKENTLIGERGVTLSGGQRARLNLARAIYYNADIYLLDDPLSAVDTKVGRHIFEKCIKGILKNKARLLVTHQLQYIQECDKVLLLEEGRMTTIQSLQSVQEVTNSNFARFLHEFDQIGRQSGSSREKDKKLPMETVNFMSAETSSSENENKLALNRIPAEDTAKGNIGLKIYLKYFTAGSSVASALFMVILLILGQSVIVVADWWLSRWAQESMNRKSKAPEYYPIIYFVLVISALCASIGRALFRFSKDVNLTDETLPGTFFECVQSMFVVLGTLMISIIIIPWVAVFVPVVIGIFLLFRMYFLATSRQIKRIEAITRSPVYGNFPLTLEGLVTIRSYRAEERFLNKFINMQNENTRVWFMFISTGRWLGLRLDLLSTSFIIVVSFLAVGLRQSLGLSPGIIGLLLSYSLQLIDLLQWGVRLSVEVEHLMVSVERILEYTQLESEAPLITDVRPPNSWPDRGEVVINKMSLKYLNTTKPAVHQLSVHLEPGLRYGIVGRTGAGKSSILQAIFRLVEPTPESGAIFIDGIDISTIGLNDLRSRISIIPQEPFCFKGSLRFNIDPFMAFTDQEIWNVLDAVELKKMVESLSEKLEAPVAENGGNWSFGEKQLICLARAILRNSKLIVMDEATAAIDLKTDALIQKAIRGYSRKENGIKQPYFAEATIITIAHRLETVIDFDRLLVLNSGSLVEFGSPYELLQKEPSDESAWFRRMVEEISNSQTKEDLKNKAREKEIQIIGNKENN
ncbi:hypothetical protein HK096_009754 [Nowakowskiella sp. JEL0078]|nr:hypothetical protein HK096_009754 [Nowakowskiella sp. JEL0078]